MKNTKLFHIFVFLFLIGCSLTERPFGANEEQVLMWKEIRGRELYCLGECSLYENHERAITFNDKKIVDNSEGYIPFDVKICSQKDCEIYVKKVSLNKKSQSHGKQSAVGRILLSSINTGEFGSWGSKIASEEFNKRVKEEQQNRVQQNKKHLETIQQWADDISKKANGKKWCHPSRITDMIINKDLLRDCLFLSDGPRWNVLQQTKEGTLASIGWADRIFFIEENEADASLYDDEFIKAGVFINIGKFQYLNALGVNKTIPRLKRIETLE